MIRALAIAALLAATGCAVATPPPIKTTLIADRLIIPRDCRAQELDWRDAETASARDPEQVGLLLDSIDTRRTLAICIARSMKEA